MLDKHTFDFWKLYNFVLLGEWPLLSDRRLYYLWNDQPSWIMHFIDCFHSFILAFWPFPHFAFNVLSCSVYQSTGTLHSQARCPVCLHHILSRNPVLCNPMHVNKLVWSSSATLSLSFLILSFSRITTKTTHLPSQWCPLFAAVCVWATESEGHNIKKF